jgi:hypothetical protein
VVKTIDTSGLMNEDFDTFIANLKQQREEAQKMIV